MRLGLHKQVCNSLIDTLRPAGAVHPFATVFASGKRDVHSTAVVVMRRDDKSFYVLAVDDGPVECLLYTPGGWSC